jgi:pSer/pThr/pTyr-binding forkhead associated (FHA) protein
LEIFWLNYQGSRIPLQQGETVVGRSPHCAVVINNRRVSRQHCSLRLAGDVLEVSDLGSSNGTWVNGAPVTQPTRLSAGDLVELGEERLEVLDAGPKLPRQVHDTERDLPLYLRELSDESEDTEQTTITGSQASSVALIESLVANGSGAPSPGKHFNRVQRAVETYLKGGERRPAPRARLELERLRRSIEATARLDGSSEASLWRTRVLSELSLESRPRN